MKTSIQIVLIAIAVIFVYLIFKSIEDPIQFERAKDTRYNATIQKLKDIRKAEEAFKSVHGRYTANWDSLINFIKHDSLRLVRRIGMLTDSMIEAGLTEKMALKQGKIIRDTIRVSALDSLFGKNYPIEKIKYVPVPDTVAEFHLGAGIIATGSGVKVPVFEAKVHNNTILRDLDRQLVINLNDQRRTNNKYPGLKVGSLEEANNNAGNWE